MVLSDNLLFFTIPQVWMALWSKFSMCNNSLSQYFTTDMHSYTKFSFLKFINIKVKIHRCMHARGEEGVIVVRDFPSLFNFFFKMCSY